MHILYIVHQFLPEFSSGTELVTLNIARMMQRAGHRVEVLTCSLDDDQSTRWTHTPSGMRHAIVEGVPVSAVPHSWMGPLADLALEDHPDVIAQIMLYLQDREFDVCHVTHPMRMGAAIHAIGEMGIPYIVTLTDFFWICYRVNLVRVDGQLCAGPSGSLNCQRACSVPPWSATSLAQRHGHSLDVLRQATTVVACSDYVAEVLRNQIPNLSIRVNPHGVDLRRFEPRLDLERPKDILTFGYLGTLSEAKGVGVLVEAFRKTTGANLRLRIVGPSYDSVRLRRRLERLASVDDRISLEGAISHREVPEFLRNIDVLCVPSLVPETASLSLYEGFAAGVPALVSDLGNLSVAVREDQCGMTIAAGDVPAWAVAIESVGRDPSSIDAWRRAIPLPVRVEEEAFFYEMMYRHSQARGSSPDQPEVGEARQK